MKQNLSTILPQELWINILGRLPIRSLLRCKFVCKSWGDLIEGGDFESSIPKSCLAFGNQDIGFAVCDEACQPLFQFGLPQSSFTYKYRVVVDSVKGLVLAWNGNLDRHRFLICNPITCEYIELPPLPFVYNSYIFGFGVSKLSGQYKILSGDHWRPLHVYTLERGGSWRSIAEETTTRTQLHQPGALVNGNLHWMAFDSKANSVICCFDLETELYTSFSPPNNNDYPIFFRLCNLEGLLCVCYNSDDFHISIWAMNNYGDVNSWIKEYTIDQRPYIRYNGILVLPLKILANGDFLFTISHDNRLFIYSKNTEALRQYGLRQQATINYCYYFNITNYTPSFLSLKRMGIHNVQSLNFR